MRCLCKAHGSLCKSKEPSWGAADPSQSLWWKENWQGLGSAAMGQPRQGQEPFTPVLYK